MSELLGFLAVYQLDHSENAEFNCIPACISAGLQYLTGKQYVPDTLKDAAYGNDWSNNATSPDAFVSFCTEQGVRLWSVQYRSAMQAVSAAHLLLARGLPVLFIQQDDYAPPEHRNTWLHACIWYKDSSATLTAMDPYIGKSVTYTEEQWAKRLRMNTLWVMEKAMIVPTGWKDDGRTLVAPNGVQVRMGFREYILEHGWDANNYPLQGEQGLSPLELANPDLGAGTQQIFRWTTLEWTKDRGVFMAWSGNEIIALRKIIASLQGQVTKKLDSSVLLAQVEQEREQKQHYYNALREIGSTVIETIEGKIQ